MMQHCMGGTLDELLLSLQLSKQAAVQVLWSLTCLARLVRAALRDATAGFPFGGATSTPLVSILRASRAPCQCHL